MDGYKLISVESRKGGVGKTTAALNLGSLLMKNHHVLLLDIDITGTSISAIRESRFWKEDARLLTDYNGSTINLLQYYTRSYLKGKPLFKFSRSREIGAVQVEDGIINVIASELYGDDASLLYDPSLLLDNLHVYWLTKLISSICEGFAGCFNDKKPCVIILDNSPGFVGLGKAVHDVLTDIGPEEAKFLTVSSLDVQDLESSLKSIYALHQEYVAKLNGANFPITQKGDEAFYAQIRLSGETEYKYYRSHHQEACLTSYQGIIVNKVAKGIVEGWTQFALNRSFSPPIKMIFETLLGNEIKDYLVPFDSVLMTQFYGSSGEKIIGVQPNLTTLRKRLNTIDGQIHMLDELGPDLLPYDLIRRADGIDKTIDALKGALIASGYEVIASKISPSWSPTMPVRDLIGVLKDLSFAPESYELYVPRRARMQREMERFRDIVSRGYLFAEKGQRDCVLLTAAVASVACELSFCFSSSSFWGGHPSWRDGEMWRGSKDNWTRLVNNSLEKWLTVMSNSYLFEMREKMTLAAYMLSPESCAYDKILREMFDDDSFVVAVKNVVSRMMSLGLDMQMLVSVIRAVTVNNQGGYSLNVDFTSFLNDVILYKKYDYSLAKDLMYKELRDAEYMDSYKKVLMRVINRWGL